MPICSGTEISLKHMLWKYSIWLPSVRKQRCYKASRSSIRSQYNIFRHKSTVVAASFHSVRGFWKREAARCLQGAMERPATLAQRTSHAAFAEDQPQSLSKGCEGAAILTMLTSALGNTGREQVENCLAPSSGWFEYLLHLRYVFQVHRHHCHQKFKTFLHPFDTRYAEPSLGAGAPAFACLRRPAGAVVWEDAASGAASQHLFLRQS